jgi:hypothetical protein
MSERWTTFARLVLLPRGQLSGEQTAFVMRMLSVDLPGWVRWSRAKGSASDAIAQEIVSQAVAQYAAYASGRPEAQTGAILRRNLEWAFADGAAGELRQTSRTVPIIQESEDDDEGRSVGGVVEGYFQPAGSSEPQSPYTLLARQRLIASIRRASTALERCRADELQIIFFDRFIEELSHDPQRSDVQIVSAVKRGLKAEGYSPKELRNGALRSMRNPAMKRFLEELTATLPRIR